MKPVYQKLILTSSLASSLLAFSCGQSTSDQLNPGVAANGSGSTSESLYVASGACYGGGVTMSTGSGTIVAYDPSNGALKRVVIDYSQYSPGDQPVAISEFDATRLLVTVENTSGRHVDLVSKDGKTVTTYLTNTTALNGALHGVKLLSDTSLLVTKSTAIEKFTPSRARILQTGAVPFVNAPASTCGTATTNMVAVDVLPNGKVLYAHAGATPNNKLGLITSTGYVTTADCLSSQAAPNTTALPTALLIHSSGKVLATYGSTTAGSNFIYSYPLNQTTNAFGTPVAAFNDGGVLVNGPSAIAEDAVTTDIFVANGLSTMNTIERFSFDSTAQTMTSKNFRIGPTVYTRCVAAMKVIRE